MIAKTVLSLAFLAILATNTVAEDKQQEGTNLVLQAVENADIRSDGATPFQLKAKLNQLAPSSSDAGTFTETWVSRERWRREFELGSFKRTEVGVGEAEWRFDTPITILPRSVTLDHALDFRTLMPRGLKVKKLFTKELFGVQATCVRLESDLESELFCIGPKPKLIILHESLSPHIPQFPQSHVSVIYSDYHKFGERYFPRSVRIIDEKQEPIEIKVSELSAEAPTDPALFAPLPEGVELANCLLNEMKPPHADAAPDPIYPNGQHLQNALVILSVIVGTDGKPYGTRVVTSAGNAFDTEALKTVGRWQFSPAQCHGHSVPAEINVAIKFELAKLNM